MDMTSSKDEKLPPITYDKDSKQLCRLSIRSRRLPARGAADTMVVNDYKCTSNHWFPARKEGAEVSHSEPRLPLSGVMQALALLASM
jgi:hypothetical protein